MERRLAVAMVTEFGLDTSALALDMTNFATYIDSTNDKAPIAQRGKAKQKRTDLRLVGLGLVSAADGGVRAGLTRLRGRPDVTQFATVVDQLVAAHTALTTAADAGAHARGRRDRLTAVVGAGGRWCSMPGQNWGPRLRRLPPAGLRYVGSVPPSDVPTCWPCPPGGGRW